MIELRKVLEVGVIPKLGVKNVLGFLTGHTHKWEYVSVPSPELNVSQSLHASFRDTGIESS